MTEWNALGYARIAQLQEAMAAEALGLLKLKGSEKVLDVGCGNGKITAQIAARVAEGRVVGVDPSSEMIAFAADQFAPAHPNLHFETGDARSLRFNAEFDLVVSFNALHWIPNQDVALNSMRRTMQPNGIAQLRLVPAGKRKSLENMIEETRRSPHSHRGQGMGLRIPRSLRRIWHGDVRGVDEASPRAREARVCDGRFRSVPRGGWRRRSL